MYYKDNLEKFNAIGLKIWEILCTEEVAVRLPNITDEQFEAVVDFVYDWVMHSEIMPAELLSYIATGLADKDFTLEDFGTFEGQDKITNIINRMI